MSDPTDIVEYLRKNAVFNYRDTYLKAADEIERLRKERDAMMLFVRGVADDVNALSTRPRDAIGFGDLVNTIQTWGDNANEIERLRKERDEARRLVCNNEAKHLPTMADPHMEARRRGWDCFKEKTDE